MQKKITLAKLINCLLRIFKYKVIKINDGNSLFHVPKEYRDIYKKTKPYTMTSPERLFALCDAVTYITNSNVSGDVVECGVWRGGSMMAVAEVLLNLHDTSRHLYLYDTYQGMSAPTKHDVDHLGQSAEDLLKNESIEVRDSVMCMAGLGDVQNTLNMTDYPSEKIHFIVGKVENTIPNVVPEKIAILRLDTDWYESTKHELEYLFPRLVPGGVIIIDDYGHWNGAKKAVDEYFKNSKVKILLNRIDYTGRIAVKVGC